MTFTEWLMYPVEIPREEDFLLTQIAALKFGRAAMYVTRYIINNRNTDDPRSATEFMFKITDSKNQQIHTDDEVEWQGKRCMVTCIFSENEIQVNPLGEGLPCMVSPTEVTVTNSFIEKLRKLSTCEELQEILRIAEARFALEQKTLKDSKPKREGTKKATVKEPEEAVEL